MQNVPNVLRKRMSLRWTAFKATLGSMWPTGCRLDKLALKSGNQLPKPVAVSAITGKELSVVENKGMEREALGRMW